MQLTKNRIIYSAFFAFVLMFTLIPFTTQATSNIFVRDAQPYVDDLKDFVNQDIGPTIVANTKFYNAVIKLLKKERYDVSNLKANVKEMQGAYKDMRAEVKNLRKDIKTTAKTATDFDEILSVISDATDEINSIVDDVNEIIEEINDELGSL